MRGITIKRTSATTKRRTKSSFAIVTVAQAFFVASFFVSVIECDEYDHKVSYAVSWMKTFSCWLETTRVPIFFVFLVFFFFFREFRFDFVRVKREREREQRWMVKFIKSESVFWFLKQFRDLVSLVVSASLQRPALVASANDTFSSTHLSHSHTHPSSSSSSPVSNTVRVRGRSEAMGEQGRTV